MKIKLWCARGSMASPPTPAQIEQRVRQSLQAFFKTGHTRPEQIDAFLGALHPSQFGGYGGNTPCIEVREGDSQLIIDAGSGIRLLGYDLLKGPCGKGKGEVHLVFTHFHWDHIMGLGFFTPLFIPGNKIHVYAVQPELKDVFRSVFKKPFFPVQLEQLGATIEYHALEPRKAREIAGFQIAPYQLDHPDPCWGYRIERGGKVFSHCVDTECTRVSRDELGADLPLYQGVDLMLFDGQYTLPETVEKVNWGHAAATLGLDIALREGIKKMLIMHFDPAATDERIAATEAQTRQYYDGQIKMARRTGVKVHPVDWSFAREGMEIEL